jgi:hypothetical protein
MTPWLHPHQSHPTDGRSGHERFLLLITRRHLHQNVKKVTPATRTKSISSKHQSHGDTLSPLECVLTKNTGSVPPLSHCSTLHPVMVPKGPCTSIPFLVTDIRMSIKTSHFNFPGMIDIRKTRGGDLLWLTSKPNAATLAFFFRKRKTGDRKLSGRTRTWDC